MHSLLQDVDDTISGYLGHMIATTRYTTGSPQEYTNTYATYPIAFKRPETGQRLEQFACPNCKVPLEVLVRSRAAVESFRTRLRLIGAALFGYALIDLAFLFPDSVDTMRKVWGSSLALAALAAVGVLGYSMVREFSLALVTKVSVEPDHKLFETLEQGNR